MSTDNKALPACDCLNDCGDDSAVRDGKARACPQYLKQEARKAQVTKQLAIDPRWADIDFDKVNAELRDLRAQVGRLQAHIDRTQPVVTNAEGYVQPTATQSNEQKKYVVAMYQLRYYWPEGWGKWHECDAQTFDETLAHIVKGNRDPLAEVRILYATEREVTNG